MSTLITRLYKDYGDAVNAVNALAKKKFDRNFIYLVSPAENSRTADAPSHAERLSAAGVPVADQADFLAAIGQGHSLVIVHAPWGESGKASTIMGKFGPEETSLTRKRYHSSTFGNAHPFSTFFDLPLLAKDPTPFATFWNMPSVVKSATPFSNWLGWPSLWRQPSSEKTFFGIPKLLRTKQSFSSWYNLPMLTKTARPFSTFFNMPELTRQATPFSAFFRVPSLIRQKGWDAQVQGWPKLTKSQTPFSDVVGVNLLLKNQGTIWPADHVHQWSRRGSPLSSLFNWPTTINSNWTFSSLFRIPLLSKRRITNG